jgi:hypothetical protein
MGGIPVDRHDDVFLEVRHCIALVRPFIELRTPSEGP